MANLISAQTGNFTAASTWHTVATGGTGDNAVELDSEAGTGAVSTSNLDSATFQPGVITVDGFALKLSAVAASPSGTFTATLRNSSAGSDVDSVTVNVSDLPSSGNGWVFFKFASTHALAGATNYIIRVVCSTTGSQVTLFRNATSNNWSRKLRTTTTQAPAASNQLVVSNQYTGAGASTAVTITMDNTATTSFGPTVSGGPPQGIVISGGSTVTLGTAASTNYYLKWKGIMLVCGGATCNWGTSGTPLDSTSTFVLEMDSTSNADSGISVANGGTWKEYGAVKTTLTTLMTADKAAAATVIALASTSGWANGDQLAFSSTTQTASQAETKNISTVDSSTQVTLSAGLTNAHSGTSPTQCMVINYTRNIKVRGVDTTHQGYFIAAATAVVIMSYAEHYQLGSATGGKRGIDIQTTTGSFSMTNCSVHDATVDQSLGAYISGSSANNITITGNGFWNNNIAHINLDATSGTSIVITDNTCIKTVRGGSTGITLSDVGNTFTGNYVSSSVSAGIIFNEAAAVGAFNNLTACNNGAEGIRFNVSLSQSGATNITFNSFTCWRNITYGVNFNSTAIQVGLSNATIFGNGTAGILLNAATNEFLLDTCTLTGDSTFAQPLGLRIITSQTATNIKLYSCTFGSTSGLFVAHSVADIGDSANGFASFVQIFANKSTFTATKTIAMGAGADWDTSPSGPLMIFNSYMRCMDFNTAGNHKTITPMGVNSIDTVIYNTASPSERLTPNSSTYKLTSAIRQYPVDSGSTKTISVYIRKSLATDPSGFAYAGNAPRLIVRRSDALGVTSDTVLATSVAANGTWEQLSGTTVAASEDGAFEVYVDCDGTSGAWVNVDDWS